LQRAFVRADWIKVFFTGGRPEGSPAGIAVTEGKHSDNSLRKTTNITRPKDPTTKREGETHITPDQSGECTAEEA